MLWYVTSNSVRPESTEPVPWAMIVEGETVSSAVYKCGVVMGRLGWEILDTTKYDNKVLAVPLHKDDAANTDPTCWYTPLFDSEEISAAMGLEPEDVELSDGQDIDPDSSIGLFKDVGENPGLSQRLVEDDDFYYDGSGGAEK